MTAELIVYALVAAGLVFWLRSVLGTKHGEEQDRYSMFVAEQEKAEQAVIEEKNSSNEAGPEDAITSLAQSPRKNYAIDNKTTENGLIEIIRADKDFDIDFFMQGAQDAFAMIVEYFAKGDREALKDLLAPIVYDAFEKAITQREERGETEETEVHAVRKALAVFARLEGKKAMITMRFIADETTVTRDKNGEVIAGNPDKTVEMQDIWTFSRDIKSKNPAWMVVETRSDFDEDNDRIPDSH